MFTFYNVIRLTMVFLIFGLSSFVYASAHSMDDPRDSNPIFAVYRAGLVGCGGGCPPSPKRYLAIMPNDIMSNLDSSNSTGIIDRALAWRRLGPELEQPMAIVGGDMAAEGIMRYISAPDPIVNPYQSILAPKPLYQAVKIKMQLKYLGYCKKVLTILRNLEV